jgi:hypothetical protein
MFLFINSCQFWWLKLGCRKHTLSLWEFSSCRNLGSMRSLLFITVCVICHLCLFHDWLLALDRFNFFEQFIIIISSLLIHYWPAEFPLVCFTCPLKPNGRTLWNAFLLFNKHVILKPTKSCLRQSGHPVVLPPKKVHTPFSGDQS